MLFLYIIFILPPTQTVWYECDVHKSVTGIICISLDNFYKIFYDNNGMGGYQYSTYKHNCFEFKLIFVLFRENSIVRTQSFLCLQLALSKSFSKNKMKKTYYLRYLYTFQGYLLQAAFFSLFNYNIITKV